MEEEEEEEEAPISIHSHSQFFFQGARAFKPLPSSYTWKRQCRRRMAGRAFARSKFNRLVPLAHLPPPLQWVSPSDRWDGAGPLIEPHLIAKEGPLPSPSEHSLSPFFLPPFHFLAATRRREEEGTPLLPLLGSVRN